MVAEPVNWALENKITAGYGQGTFQPNATCTRAMLAAFVNNYAKMTKVYNS